MVFDLEEKKFHYKRARFATHLPRERFYTAGHYWLAVDQDDADVYYVGYTKIATRMLGDIVEFDFEKEPSSAVKLGEIIGWIEGFKASSDIYAIVDGTFISGNPALEDDPDLMRKEPYGSGWLYKVKGTIDPAKLSREEYGIVLDATIDKILEGEEHE